MENLQIIIDYLKESERNHFEEEPSKEHIFVKTVLAGQELRQLTNTKNTDDKLAEISQGTTWDNWENEDKPGEYWKVTEVLYCQLDWVKENLPKENEGDNYELYDIVTKVQELLTAMGKDSYKNN